MNSTIKYRVATALALLPVLVGCAHRPDTAAAAAALRDSAVAARLGVIASDKAKVVFRTVGSFRVDYELSTSPQACEDFQLIGEVYDDSNVRAPDWMLNFRKVAGALLKMHPWLERDVEPGVQIQIRAMGHGMVTEGRRSGTGTCGPLMAKFTPEAGRAYLVTYIGNKNTTCVQAVQDATDVDAPFLMPVGQPRMCEVRPTK